MASGSQREPDFTFFEDILTYWSTSDTLYKILLQHVG